MKRLVAIALTLILCLSLCSFAAAEETDVYGKYEEPIKLTILSEDFKTGNTNYDANDPRRASATQNVWIDAYKDYLNIDVERQIAEDETALAALINTAMASGDLPDVIICNKAMFYTLVENGVLQDVRAAYEGYQQKRLVKDALDSLDMWDACTVDGQLLAVPCVNNFYNNTQILWIRQDWLDKVNMEAPKTLDEMIAVAQAFKDAKLGGEDTIGIAMTGTTSHNYDAILAAYGAIAGCWQPKEDGTYEYAYVSDTARGGLLKMQEIYEKGLVVPDMAVCDDKTVAEQIANGRAGMYYATGWHVVTDMKTSMVNDPEAVWTCVAAPSVDGERFKQWTNANCHTFTCVTTACKNPEAVFKMMELEQHMYTEPTDEEIPKYYADPDDAFLYWDLRIFRNFGRGDFDFYRSKLINEALEKNLTVDEVAPVIKDFYAQCLKAKEGDRSMLGRLICQTEAYPLQNSLLEGGWLVPAYNGPLTETMSVYESTLLDDLRSAIAKVITGEDISVWEKAVQDWYANGGQTITDEVNEYYASQK